MTEPDARPSTLFTERQSRWLDALLAFSTVLVFFLMIGVVGGAFSAFGDVILTFFLAWLIAFAISPVAHVLVRIVPALPRKAAVVIVYGAILAALVFLTVVVADALARSINDLLVNLPKIEQDLAGFLAPLQGRIDALGLKVDLATLVADALATLRAGAVDLLGPLQQLAVAGFGILGSLLIIVFLSIFIALDSEAIGSFLWRLVPAGLSEDARVLQESVGRSFGGFLRGQAIQGLVYAGVAFGTSLVFGLDFVPLTTVSAGVLQAIPFFGPFVSWAPPVLVAIVFRPEVTLPVLLAMAIGWLVVMNVLQPRIMADALDLHPIVVLGSVIVGIKVAGVAGAIFGIPLAGILAALFFHILRTRGASGTVAERAARRVTEREGRFVRVPREPTPGRDVDIPEPVE